MTFGPNVQSEVRDRIPPFIRERLGSDNDTVIGFVTLSPIFLLLIFVVFIPVAWAVYTSFFSVNTLSRAREFTGLSNYQHLLFQDATFWASMWRAFYFAVGSTLFQLALAIPTAILLNRKLKGVAIARAVALLPYLIPTIVVGMTFTWMMHPELGIFSNMAQWSGLADRPVSFFGSSNIAMPSLIVANSWKFVAFMTMIFLARLQSIPDNHYEAAKMCGANAYELFRDVTLPNLRSVILLALLLRGIFMFNKFDIIWILTEGGPANATTTLPVFVYKMAFVNYNMGEALAASTILFVFLVAAGIVYLRFFNPAEEVET